MSGADEVQAQAVVKANKLAMTKKIILAEWEQLRCDMLEVVTGSGVAHSYHEIKETSTNPWMKLHNGLWDNNSGVNFHFT